jgi:hypothetical protein
MTWQNIFCVREYFSITKSVKKKTCQCGKNILRIFLLAHVHDVAFLALKVDNI